MSLNELLLDVEKPWAKLVVDALKVTNSGAPLVFNAADVGFAGILKTVQPLTAARTWTLPDSSGTFTLSGGASTSVVGHLASFSDVNGDIQDSGIASSAVVQQSGASVVNNLPKYNSISGQLIDSGIPVSSIGAAGVAKGDLRVYNGSAWVIVSVGTDGQVLTANAASPAGVHWA